ncbi:histidine kinase, partial [Tyzzerella sp. OttesenSCG-928-J15]|nr:histidine kinase [Tyzzerella sp. OttesenSCG-928-J15]
MFKTAGNFFTGLKLNQKFTLSVFCVVLLPVMLLATAVFSNLSKIVKDDKISAIEADLSQMQANVKKTVDLCNMTTQVFVSSDNLESFLEKAKGGYSFSSAEIIDFYRDDVAVFERLINSNPYLYQVRVFYENGQIPEMMPVLYSYNRLQNLSWAETDWQSGTWQFDYWDSVFSGEVSKPEKHLMSLVSVLDNYDAGKLGVLEVSVRMNEIMPELFNGESGSYTCFLSGGKTYCDSGQSEFWGANEEKIFGSLDFDLREIKTISMEINGGRHWVSVVPLPYINGHYIALTPLSRVESSMDTYKNGFAAAIVLLLAILGVAINVIVKIMLKRLYTVFGSIIEIQNGSMEAVIPDLGNDEVGILAKQINIMVERILRLMKENTDKQILAKNHEIKALQSQINAHFIYNVLESIKMMAEVDEKYEIADALQALGELLRYSMRLPQTLATLGEEIENVENYLALMNLRFENTINLRPSLELRRANGLKLPKMTLQPIVENAVIHGIEGMSADTFIDIGINEDEDFCEISVTNYGKVIEPERLSEIRLKLEASVDTASGKS